VGACRELSCIKSEKTKKLSRRKDRRGKVLAVFQVIEAGEGIEGAILRGLGARPRGLPGRTSPEHPSLLVVSPKAAVRGLDLPASCRTVLLPGDMRERGGLQAASAVSYGPSPRDSLTISSCERGRLWAALQRELVTVDGQVVERQEFPIPMPHKGEELSALAAAGALLLLGVPPEEVGRGLEQ